MIPTRGALSSAVRYSWMTVSSVRIRRSVPQRRHSRFGMRLKIGSQVKKSSPSSGSLRAVDEAALVGGLAERLGVVEDDLGRSPAGCRDRSSAPGSPWPWRWRPASAWRGAAGWAPGPGPARTRRRPAPTSSRTESAGTTTRMPSGIPSGRMEPTEVNRAHWDSLARVHGQDGYYDSEALIAGRWTLDGRRSGGRRRRRAGSICCTCSATSDSTRSRWHGGVRGSRAWTSRASALARGGRLAARSGVSIEWVQADSTALPETLARALRHRLRDDRRAVLDCGRRRLDAQRVQRAAAGRAARAGGDPPADLHVRHALAAARWTSRTRSTGRASSTCRAPTPIPTAVLDSTASVEYGHSLGEVVTRLPGRGVPGGRAARAHGQRARSPRRLLAAEADGRYRAAAGRRGAAGSVHAARESFVNLYVERRGSGPRVLLLHGVAGSSRTYGWLSLDGHEVVALRLPRPRRVRPRARDVPDRGLRGGCDLRPGGRRTVRARGPLARRRGRVARRPDAAGPRHARVPRGPAAVHGRAGRARAQPGDPGVPPDAAGRAGVAGRRA